MIERLKQILHVVLVGKQKTEETIQETIKLRSLVSGVMAASSFVLSVINLITGSYFMMVTTFILFGAFLVCIILINKYRYLFASEIITAGAVVLVFSYYALYGENDGFAILWILLVPAVGSLFLSYKTSLIITAYFAVFTGVIFYTPVKNIVPGMSYYNEQFQIRFPVLYLSSSVLAIFLSTQMLYFSIVSQNNSLYDFLTDLKNRRYCNDFVSTLENKPLAREFTVLSLDINNLKYINDTFGHENGDKIIKGASDVLKHVFKDKSELIFRMGGDEFTIFFKDKNNEIDNLINEIHKNAEKISINNQTLAISVGYAKSREYITLDVNGLMKIAENNMYKDKDLYYQTHNIDRRKANSSVNDLKISKK